MQSGPRDACDGCGGYVGPPTRMDFTNNTTWRCSVCGAARDPGPCGEPRALADAPVDGTPVLAFCHDADGLVIVTRLDGKWILMWDETEITEIECWWPLPPLPAEVFRYLYSKNPLLRLGTLAAVAG